MKKIILGLACAVLSSGLFAHGRQVFLFRDSTSGQIKAFSRSRSEELLTFLIERKCTDEYAVYKIKGDLVSIPWKDIVLLDGDETLTIQLPFKRAGLKKRKELRGFAHQQVSRYNNNR
jgi:hypothetical protein